MSRLTRFAAVMIVASAIFLVLGNARDPWLWAYLTAFATIGGYAMASIDDDLARERFQPPTGGADRLSLRTIRLVALAHIVTALLDGRFQWSIVPSSLRMLGLIGFTASFLVIVRAMKANRYFSAVVRIQDDRGHRVVNTGPYAIIRHPGYAGMILGIPMSGLALGSWWGTVVGIVYSALILKRVFFEDRFLHERLNGYAQYARDVRYRLIPGVW